MADTTTNNCTQFAEALGLRWEPDGLFVGKIRGFPVGLKIINPQENPVLLFQIRHWLPADAPQVKSLTFERDLAKLMADKAIDIEFEDKLVWLTVNDVEQCLQLAPISQLIESTLQTFEKAGLIGDPDLCHYCQKEKVEELSTSAGKVAQICGQCLSERMSKDGRQTSRPGAEAVPIALMSPFAALVGALLWMGCWILHTLIFESSGSEIIVVPRLVLGIVAVAVAFLVGGPVGGIIRLNKRRGHAASIAGAIVFGTLAVIAGEIFYLVWLVYHIAGFVSFRVALRILPDFYLENDRFFISLRVATAVACVVMACAIAKPEAVKLKL